MFAKQLNRHIFGYQQKFCLFQTNVFKDFSVRKKDICNRAVLSPTALLQLSFVEIILRLPVDI